MTKDEALKLALEALEEAWYHVGTFQPTEKAIDLYDEARTAIKKALAQPEQDGKCKYCTDGCLACDARKSPEQEPVAWVSSEELLVMRGNALGGAKDWRINVGLVKQEGDVGLYTTPPQRKPLTDEEITEEMPVTGHRPITSFAKAIEAKLKEKNT